MADSGSERCEVIDQLAEEFAARYRRGERPALQEYLDRYPELAGDIRALFPALVQMEQVKEDRREPAAAATPVPVQQIGDYRLLREVGRGGMGVVYEAEQVSLGRRVALKVLPLHAGGDGKALERFRREARAAAQLHHTNIVPVHEVGQHGDVCFYAMQFIPGQSLDQIIDELHRLRSRPPGQECEAAARAGVDQLAQSLLSGRFQVEAPAITPAAPSGAPDPLAAATECYGPTPAAIADASSPDASETTASAVFPGQTGLSGVRTDRQHYYRSVARIGLQASQALAHAHARGIIHRDIKPSNLLLDTAGVVWITDFGLAKTQDAALTTTGDIVGTLRYMAPERFRGEGDERADIYGLGLTLYELLALRAAFEAHNRLRLIDRIKNEEPAGPRTVDPRIPRDLETIVLKAMHKEAAQRYRSAEEMAEDLRRFLADEPIRARRTSSLARLRLWGRRHPALAGLVILLVLVAVGSTAAAFYLRATLAATEKAEREGQHKLWLAYLNQAQARRMSRQPGQHFASLQAIREALALPVPPGRSRDELRTEAIAALCLTDLELDHEGRTTTLSVVKGLMDPAFDPAFQRYAVLDWDGKVRLFRLSDDRELLELQGGGMVTEYGALEFSPDGRFLHQRYQVSGGSRSRLWDLDSPQRGTVLAEDPWGLAFRPDGREIAALYPDQTVRFFDPAASLRERRRFPIALLPKCRLRWNPRLPQLLVASPSSLELLNVDTGAVAAVGPKLPGGYAWVDWHPEGRLLAVCGEQDHTIYLWDVAAGRLALPPLEGHKESGTVMRFNRAGDRLLSTDWSSAWHLWDTRSGQLLMTAPIEGVFLHFSPDDRLVGSGWAGKIRTYRFRRGAEVRTVVHPGSNKQRKGYTCYGDSGVPWMWADNHLAAFRTDDGVALVDVARGEEVGLLPLPGNSPLGFDPEGALWTVGPAGLLRWPVAADPKSGQRRYGPPQRKEGPINNDRIGSSADMGVVAAPAPPRLDGPGVAAKEGGGVVFHREGKRLLRLEPEDGVIICAVSPDGRWVATASHALRQRAGAKVWDAHTGRHVQDLPVGGVGLIQFSPDGKWLLTTFGGCRLWAVGTWEEGPRPGGESLNRNGAFSRDGKLLALGDAPGVVRLVVTDTGAEVVRLTAPEQVRLLPCCFTPDGTQLLALGYETGAVYVFDLRAIRAGLAELDLDWDVPPLPAAPASPPKPLSIHLDLGDVLQRLKADALVGQAAQHSANKEHAKALAALRQAVQVAPSHSLAHNNLAWLLLTGPRKLRDPAQALVQARQAVELEPDQSTYHNTLGVALYRTGQFAEAIPVLERSLAAGKGQTDAFDLFFLAMCHQRRGDAARAKECLAASQRWFQEHKDKLPAAWIQELSAFQAEAEAVLAERRGQP
jgi:serine/threonine protein kinase/WD40 repeat protein/Tfp pilus assembly protein PilF